jgi:ArsR family transcriptional regulator
MIDRDAIQRQAGVLKALGHESRLLIVHRLGEGDCTAGELTELVGSDQSTVSKHLALLRLHGIVADRREGNSVVYSLRTPCVLEFFACTGRVISELGS